MSLQENISTLTVPVNTHAETFEDIDVDAFELSDEEFNAKYGTGNHGLGSSIQMIQKPQNNSVAKAAAQKRATRAARKSMDDDTHISDLYTDYIIECRPDISAYRLDDETFIHRWNGRCFEPMSLKDGITNAVRWLRSNHKKKATNAVAKEAWSTIESNLREERFFVDRDLDGNTVIPLFDGYLHFDNLTNITLKAPDATLGFRHIIDVKCGLSHGQALIPAALRPDSRFAGFLNHITTDLEEQRYLQELAALLILPDNFQVCVWLYGKPKSSKSVFKDLMALFHSQRSVVQMSLNRIDNPFETERLLGASLITTDEVKDQKAFHEEAFKAIVSQAPISIARKNKTSINNYKLRAKWIICSNQAPKVSESSEGVWRRIGLFEFKNPVPEKSQVKDYHKVLFNEEGYEILQWVLEGAQRLLKRGRFLEESEWPEACRRTKNAARIESNTVTHWLTEQNVTTCGLFTDKTIVYNRYLDFCTAAHVEPFAPNIFWRHVKAQCDGVIEKKLKIKDAMGRYTQPYVVNVTWSMGDDKDVEYLNEIVDIPFGK